MLEQALMTSLSLLGAQFVQLLLTCLSRSEVPVVMLVRQMVPVKLPCIVLLWCCAVGYVSMLLKLGRFLDLGPVYRSVTFRDFGGETRRWRLNQHHIPIDVAKLFTLFSTV